MTTVGQIPIEKHYHSFGVVWTYSYGGMFSQDKHEF